MLALKSMRAFAHVAQPADELEVFQAGEMGVDDALLRAHSRRRRGSLQIVADTAAFEEHLARRWAQQAGNDLDGGGFAEPLGPT